MSFPQFEQSFNERRSRDPFLHFENQFDRREAAVVAPTAADHFQRPARAGEIQVPRSLVLIGVRAISNIDKHKTKKSLIATAVLTACFALGMILAGALMAATPFTLIFGIALAVTGAGTIACGIPTIVSAVRMARLKKVQDILNNKPAIPPENSYANAGLSCRREHRTPEGVIKEIMRYPKVAFGDLSQSLISTFVRGFNDLI